MRRIKNQINDWKAGQALSFQKADGDDEKKVNCCWGRAIFEVFIHTLSIANNLCRMYEYEMWKLWRIMKFMNNFTGRVTLVLYYNIYFLRLLIRPLLQMHCPELSPDIKIISGKIRSELYFRKNFHHRRHLNQGLVPNPFMSPQLPSASVPGTISIFTSVWANGSSTVGVLLINFLPAYL